jgi:2-polyprenyl-3-methyl-5-hydroxy-6-metoxy-1,4-benzoquinol methylase
VADEQTIEDLLARLERERLAADRLYNDALTAVDRAIQRVPPLPDGPAPYDTSRLETLNRTWNLLPDGAPAVDASLKGRLRAFVWRMVGPSLETQKQFNAALVDHLNRNVAAHEQASRATSALIQAIGRELEALVRFESLLIQSLQTITVYVDSKDRSLGGSDIRQRLALTEQRVLALKRTIEERRAGEPRAIAATHVSQDVVFGGGVDALTYVGFEDRFRGTQQEIRRRVEDYLPILSAASDVVDIGCGRGELLTLLAERGIRARGVDANAAMVEVCRSRGLAAEEGDALSFLQRQSDASLGGVIAIQVVEHFAPPYLAKFLETAFHKMRPGAPLVLETINPSCWMAFFETYLRDVTHRQALHADTLRYLVQASGFMHVDVQFRAPVDEADRLAAVPAPDPARPVDGRADPIARLAAAVNDHAEKLNKRLFSHMDYVVIARR